MAVSVQRALLGMQKCNSSAKMYCLHRLHSFRVYSIEQKTCVRFVSTNVEPSRNTAVTLEPTVQKLLEEEKIKVKDLPGKRALKAVEIPERLEKAIDVLVKKYPLKQLAINAQKLAVHLWNRRLPSETAHLREKAKRIEEKLREKEGKIDMTTLSNEQIETLERKRRRKILQMLRSSTYHWQPVSQGHIVLVTGLRVEEAKVPGENHRAVTSTCQLHHQLFPMTDKDPFMEQSKTGAAEVASFTLHENLFCINRYDGPKAFLYLIGRMAQDYATVLQCFNEIVAGDPEYKPRTLFDMGSGVGSVVWAANKTWGDKVFEYYCCDTSSEMNTLARLLLQDGNENKSMKIRGVHFRQFPPSDQTNKFDVVVCAFTLLELPSTQHRLDMIKYLWNMTEDYMILVENGTNAGFKCISEARNSILKKSVPQDEVEGQSHVFAPCPHDLTCPKLLGNVPCSFNVDYRPLKISLSDPHHTGNQIQKPLSGYSVFIQHMKSTQQKVSDAAKMWKDLPNNEKEVHNEKAKQINAENIKKMVENKTIRLSKNQSAKNHCLYSYVILKKEKRKAECNWPRQILDINKTPKYVQCRFCCADGKLRDITLTKNKHGKMLYRCATKTKWGDRVPFILKEKSGTDDNSDNKNAKEIDDRMPHIIEDNLKIGKNDPLDMHTGNRSTSECASDSSDVYLPNLEQSLHSTNNTSNNEIDLQTSFDQITNNIDNDKLSCTKDKRINMVDNLKSSVYEDKESLLNEPSADNVLDDGNLEDLTSQSDTFNTSAGLESHKHSDSQT